MKQGLLVLQWRPPLSSPRLPLSLGGTIRYSLRASAPTEISAGGGDGGGELTARERRQLRKERRESKAGSGNWREDVEERLLKKPKKRRGSWMEELNLDNLARLGPQWWVLRVSRVISLGQEAVDRLVRSLASNFPDLEFKVSLS
ncbi:hypothetical protein COCNU_scaffold024208G000010 [Cocos nucifera]|nr:hypothetical protein [Cocos nucifera]